MIDARAIVERFRDGHPIAARLAEMVSLAVRVEPELLRRLRLSIDGAPASIEADLWFSDLVAAESNAGIALVPEVAEELRRALATDKERLESAGRLIEGFHSEHDAPWSIRLEEKIMRLSLSDRPADADLIRDLLLAAGQQMVASTSPRDVSRWLMRALLTLPPAIRESVTGRMLATGARARLGREIDLPEGRDAPSDAFENWLPWLLPDASERVTMHVRLAGGTLEIGPAAGPDTHPLELPITTPLLLELRWSESSRSERRLLRLAPDETRRVAVPASAVQLRTADGREHELARDPANGGRPSGAIDFGPVRARHRPFCGYREQVEAIEKRLLGERPDGGGSGYGGGGGSGGYRGWIVISGPEGAGKTALLSHVLDRCEEQGFVAPHHYLTAGPRAWSERDVIEGSLRAQLFAAFPELAGDLPPDVPLDELLGHASERLPAHERPGIAIFLDDLQGEEESDQTMAHRARVLPSIPPARVHYVVSMHHSADLRFYLEKNDPLWDIPMTEGGEDAAEACRELVEAYADVIRDRAPASSTRSSRTRSQEQTGAPETFAAWADRVREAAAMFEATDGTSLEAALEKMLSTLPIPSVAPELVVLERAGGTPATARAMIDWLQSRPPSPFNLRLMPPTLYVDPVEILRALPS